MKDTLSLIGLCALAAMASSADLDAATASIPLHDLPQGTRYAIWGDSIAEVTMYPKFVEAYLLACAGRGNITTGLVSGTPTKSGHFTMQVAAMNATGITPVNVALTIKDK